MDMWGKLPLRSEDPYRINRKAENPSFSSTVLDAIYRSIDESNGTKREEELIHYRETMKKNSFKKGEEEKEEIGSTTLRRAGLVEKLMEKKVVSCEKVVVRRKSMAADFPQKGFNSVLWNSSSSNSSGSSCGSIGGFSSSESDSYDTTTARSRPSATITTNYTAQRPKPIRTSISARPVKFDIPHANVIDTAYNVRPPTKKPNSNKQHEGSFVKTKSKALKIYSDLKKAKQPLSPGGRLASFLNSIFNTAGTAKKAKYSSSGGVYEERSKLKSEQASSACSSASSFSRSCLSKAPSSGGKSTNNGTKRSVKFFPVSMIVDEDCRPCGHKSLDQSQHIARNINEEVDDFRVMEENRRVVVAAKELLKSYQKKKEEVDMRDVSYNNKNEVPYDDDEEEDDAASCASSDLFELDNLSYIGIERYHEELPVYETTHFRTNRAIC